MKIVTTKTKLFIYKDEKCNELIGSAGVKNPKDFDYKSLCNLALREIGENLQVG